MYHIICNSMVWEPLLPPSLQPPTISHAVLPLTTLLEPIPRHSLPLPPPSTAIPGTTLGRSKPRTTTSLTENRPLRRNPTRACRLKPLHSPAVQQSSTAAAPLPGRKALQHQPNTPLFHPSRSLQPTLLTLLKVNVILNEKLAPLKLTPPKLAEPTLPKLVPQELAPLELVPQELAPLELAELAPPELAELTPPELVPQELMGY
ncbi:hypothetical protein F0562_018234 [Nyssa sinensis]|uniref:Uncharacterized protein n=1 Tax=Nyssa sinensis TaxID=561372 RepID=A0A5J4ZAK7_9ASTE|nr:hypothetical protein F0562_018234 [Nyssa sinensis]